MKSDIRLSETTEAGASTRESVVRATTKDRREWLAGAPVCAALARHGMAHVGVADAAHPYRVVRTDLSGTFLMVCCFGEGQVRLDGKWRPMRAGTACVVPPHAFHAYRAVPGKRWGLAWVRYQEPAGSRPFVSANGPVLARFDGEPLRAAIDGLHREAADAADPAALQLWSDLVEFYAQRLLHPWRSEDRLHELWSQVIAHIHEPWPVERAARVAGLGERQLCRVCRGTLGRTYVQQVTWLRLQRAASLLVTTKDKVEAIARSVGYRSLFTFSRKFQQFTGCRPSAHRAAAG